MAYAWIIDTDHQPDPDAEPRTNSNAAGMTGPSGAPGGLLAKLASGDGDQFRMYDDDRILYYSGRLLSDDADGSQGEDGFGPLDDFGGPNAGAVTIKYLNRLGEWETL